MLRYEFYHGDGEGEGGGGSKFFFGRSERRKNIGTDFFWVRFQVAHEVT